DQALIDQELVGFLFGGEARDVVARARRAVDHAEDRIGAAACGKALGDTGGADGPAALRLMACEAGPAVGPEVLEECIVECEGRPVGLEGANRAARIGIEAEAWNDRRRRLRAVIG